MTTVVSKRGQVVIPSSVREALSLEPGDDLEIKIEDGDTILLRRISKRPNEGLLELLRSCPHSFEIPERESDFPREVEIG